VKIQLGAPSLVSVIIPVFNGARSLETTVMNVLEQGYSNMEVLIGDNCSTDSTWQVIQKLTSTYPFIKAIRNTHNVGAIKNIENLFNSATGDLIWLRSSGDHYSKAI
jgi:glycosyltransferase involved in cell wall biosynthesis